MVELPLRSLLPGPHSLSRGLHCELVAAEGRGVGTGRGGLVTMTTPALREPAPQRWSPCELVLAAGERRAGLHGAAGAARVIPFWGDGGGGQWPGEAARSPALLQPGRGDKYLPCTGPNTLSSAKYCLPWWSVSVWASGFMSCQDGVCKALPERLCAVRVHEHVLPGSGPPAGHWPRLFVGSGSPGPTSGFPCSSPGKLGVFCYPETAARLPWPLPEAQGPLIPGCWLGPWSPPLQTAAEMGEGGWLWGLQAAGQARGGRIFYSFDFSFYVSLSCLCPSLPLSPSSRCSHAREQLSLQTQRPQSLGTPGQVPRGELCKSFLPLLQ